MKKLLLLLSVIMMFTLSGCNNENIGDPSVDVDVTSESAESRNNQNIVEDEVIVGQNNRCRAFLSYDGFI